MIYIYIYIFIYLFIYLFNYLLFTYFFIPLFICLFIYQLLKKKKKSKLFLSLNAIRVKYLFILLMLESKDAYLSPICHFKQLFYAHTEVMGNLGTHPGICNSYIILIKQNFYTDIFIYTSRHISLMRKIVKIV
jgi:hypothetical protein